MSSDRAELGGVGAHADDWLAAARLETTAGAPRAIVDIEAAALASRPGIRFIDAPGSRIRVRIEETPGAATLVILPDGPNTIEQHDPVFDRLRGIMSVVALEIPGFGFSYAHDPLSLTLEGCVRDVAHALGALELDEVVLCGACVQAYVAIGLAAEMGSTVIGVVAMQATDSEGERRWLDEAIDPAGILRQVGAAQRAWADPQKRERALIDRWYPAAAAAGFDVAGWQETARWAFRSGCSYALPSLVQSWLTPPSWIPAPWHGPARILFGTADQTHAQCRSDPSGLIQLLPNAEVRLLADAGHFPDLERIDVFLETVQALTAVRSLADS